MVDPLRLGVASLSVVDCAPRWAGDEVLDVSDVDLGRTATEHLPPQADNRSVPRRSPIARPTGCEPRSPSQPRYVAQDDRLHGRPHCMTY